MKNMFHPVEVMSCQDLADHGQLGRPYEIVVNEVVGRHLVAVRDVKAGEVGNYNMSNNNMGKYSMSNNKMSNKSMSKLQICGYGIYDA